MRVIVSCDGNVESVAERLALAGLTVDRILPRLRIVTGTVETRLASGLAAIEGVAAVEVDRQVGIA